MNRIKIFCFVFLFVGMSALAQAQGSSTTTTDLGSALKDLSTLNAGNQSVLSDVYGAPGGGGWDWGKLLANIIFSSIGFVAFIYGKKNSFWRPMILGIALIGYSYCISVTWAVYLVGVALTAALFFWRD